MLKKILTCLTLLVSMFGMVSCRGEHGAPYEEPKPDSRQTGERSDGMDIGLTSGRKGTFNLRNATTHTLYVYDFPYGNPAATAPVMLAAAQSLDFALTPNKNEMRLYVAHEPLKNSIEKGEAPDPFNYSRDATVMYSFLEYYYEQDASRYTVDLSYIDEYSYPVTVSFTDVPDTFTGCEPGFTYGFSSLAAVREALKKQTDYHWDALIWPATVHTVWDSDKYPANMYRIIGPNRVWPAVGNWVPDSYGAFTATLPMNGMQLFGSDTNWNGWQQRVKADNPSPSDTGYVKALHQAAKADKNGKYGFFCYPRDNADGEFTRVPEGTACTITIHPFDK
jgi:hypothetical protein